MAEGHWEVVCVAESLGRAEGDLAPLLDWEGRGEPLGFPHVPLAEPVGYPLEGEGDWEGLVV